MAIGNPKITSVVKIGAIEGGCLEKRNSVGCVRRREATRRMRITIVR